VAVINAADDEMKAPLKKILNVAYADLVKYSGAVASKKPEQLTLLKQFMA